MSVIERCLQGSSSPPLLSTTDLEEKLGKVCEEIKMLRMEGSSPLPVSTIEVELEELLKKLQKGRMEGSSSPPTLPTTDLEEKLGKVCEEIERLSVKGTLPPPELFIADFGEELKQLCKELNRQRMKGRSPPPVSIIRVVIRLQKVRMEALENAMYQTIRSGLAKFDVSLPEELQSYVSYLLNELAKLGLRRQVLQSPCAMEELRKVMNKNELKTFLTIHIREGAWQVVLLFMDELPKYKLSRDWYPEVWDEDEMFSIPLYSSKSGILRAWPTEYDPGLVTLCKAITNRDWKVTRLILSSSRTSDEGLKILSKALTQSELYSLTLYCIGLQSQGLKHLCEALISGDCNLTRLNVSNNRLGDEGILHLCNPLTNGNCTLTSLNVSDNMLGDEGIVHLCNALTSVNCKLTSLNVSDNTLGDEGIMHLCNALTSVNCTLTSLNVSDNRLGDKGIVYLCKALTDTKCKLKSLNLHANWNVTDVGQKYLFQMLTGTDWEVRGGLRLSRSTRKRSKSQVSGTEP